jgi:site-specific DNA-methyltransferase (adenine-specific)
MRTTDLGFEPITREVMAFCADRFADICQRWCLVFSDVEIAHEWRSELQVAGMEYVRTGAWIKIGCTPQFTGDRPAAGHESITITHRPGKKRWNGGGSHAVWSVPIVLNRGGNAERVHTTQKPLALMRELVRLFTDPGETVLDCFGGSGTTAVACRDLGRRCIVVEREEKYCALIVERLRQQILLAPAAPQPEQSALDLEATR